MRLLLAIAFIAACAHSTPTPTATAVAPVAPVAPTPSLTPAMAKLAFMRGIWTGDAEGTTPEGTRYKVTQTERMGPMLGGDIIVIEGRGYRPDGSTGFNAFAVVSYNVHTQKYEIRSYAQGNAGTFPFEPTATGYVWEVPAGRDAVMRFTATVSGDRWREVGEYIAAGQAPVPSFEMNLRRVAETDWPLTTPVSPSVR